jgi:hypothetical protein
MKKTVFLLASLFVMACGIQSVKAQTASATQSATANATIITPISITNVADLNFGNIVAGTGAGTVTVATTGNRTSTGDVILPSATLGTVNAAELSHFEFRKPSRRGLPIKTLFFSYFFCFLKICK